MRKENKIILIPTMIKHEANSMVLISRHTSPILAVPKQVIRVRIRPIMANTIPGILNNQFGL